MDPIRKLFLIVLILPAMLLSACGGVLSVQVDRPEMAPADAEMSLPTQVVTMVPANSVVDMGSSSDEIRQALLYAPTRWQTLWVSGAITQHLGVDGIDVQTLALEAWVDQANARFRLLSGMAESQPGLAQISDGQQLMRVTLPSGVIDTSTLPETVKAAYQPATGAADAVEAHPLGMLMDTPARPILFPTELAQRAGTFYPVELSQAAGRPALLVEWQTGEQEPDRMWIDTATGQLLRWQSRAKGQSFVSLEVEVQQIVFDPAFDAGLFDLGLSVPLAYTTSAGSLPTPQPETPPSIFAPGEGQLYFNVYGPTSGLHLVRLPSSCVGGSAPCLAPVSVPGYPNTGSSILPLIWSPDGSQAALTLSDQALHQTLLWRYHPSDESWTVLMQAPVIYEAVAWSPDSQWVAFSSVNTDGEENLFALRADGSEARDLTSGALAGADVRLSPVAWLDNYTILFEYIQGVTSHLYSVRLDGALPEPFGAQDLFRGVVAVSPDRTRLAIGQQTAQGGSELVFSDLNGEDAKRLFSIQNASIQQVTFSADGAWVGFFTLTSGGSDGGSAAVYIARPDGSDLRQIYQSRSLAQIAFAPDAPYLVAADNDSMKLAVAPLEGGQIALLSAPGLLPDDQLLGFSWRLPR